MRGRGRRGNTRPVRGLLPLRLDDGRLYVLPGCSCLGGASIPERRAEERPCDIESLPGVEFPGIPKDLHRNGGVAGGGEIVDEPKGGVGLGAGMRTAFDHGRKHTDEKVGDDPCLLRG